MKLFTNNTPRFEEELLFAANAQHTTETQPALLEAVVRTVRPLALCAVIALGVASAPAQAQANTTGETAVIYCVAGGTVLGLLTLLTTFSVTATAAAATFGCVAAGGQEALAEALK